MEEGKDGFPILEGEFHKGKGDIHLRALVVKVAIFLGTGFLDARGIIVHLGELTQGKASWFAGLG